MSRRRRSGASAARCMSAVRAAAGDFEPSKAAQCRAANRTVRWATCPGGFFASAKLPRIGLWLHRPADGVRGACRHGELRPPAVGWVADGRVRVTVSPRLSIRRLAQANRATACTVSSISRSASRRRAAPPGGARRSCRARVRAALAWHDGALRAFRTRLIGVDEDLCDHVIALCQLFKTLGVHRSAVDAAVDTRDHGGGQFCVRIAAGRRVRT